MSSQSSSGAKKALKWFFLIVLALGALSLYFARDIGQVVQEWRSGQNGPEKVTLPEPDSSGQQPSSKLSVQDFAGAFSSAAKNGANATNSTGNAGPEGGAAVANATSDKAAGPIVVMEDSGLPGEVSVTTESGRTAKVGGISLPVHEDSVISLAVIEDLARRLVNSYYPAGTFSGANSGELLSLSLRTLNLHYATRTESYFKKSRLDTLRYVLTPSMLEALYRLYAGKLIEDMKRIASSEPRELGGVTRVLKAAEQKEMFLAYAGLATGVAGVLEACVASHDISKRLDNYYQASTVAAARNVDYLESAQVREEARRLGGEKLARANQVYEKAMLRYQQGVIVREQAKDELLSALRKYPHVRNLDDGNIIYTAAWINRRLADHSADNRSLAAAAKVLNNLAARFKTAAGQ